MGASSGAERSADILVAGAGAAGLSAAIALAEAGFSVVCVGHVDRRANGRTLALFEASLRFYKALGLWPKMREKAAPIEKIRMIDATGARLSAPSVAFAASEIGLAAFGANIENDSLVAGLADHATACPGLELHEGLIDDLRFGTDKVQAMIAGGRTIEAKLVVAADGRGSLARKRAGLGARTWTYPQVALTALLSHEKPHRNLSTEFHTRAGPCTLVPLRPCVDAPHRSSLVWLMSPEDAERRRDLDDERLAADVTRQVEHFLGRMAMQGARGYFPMAGMSTEKLAGHRIALVGEAAHVFPPLAAQGLNLSLRDCAALVEILEDARDEAADIGTTRTLAGYDRSRRNDVYWRTNGVDILNRSLLMDMLPVDVLRGAGLFAFSMIGPLRRAIMREGVVPHGHLPRLMQKRPRQNRPRPPAALEHRGIR
jgi:2-octaprenyl-6-methoxyphenol hydroxylase